MKQRIQIVGVLFIVVVLGLAGCQSASPTPTSFTSPLSSPETRASSTSATSGTPENPVSPLATPEGSTSTHSVDLEGPLFSLNEPLNEGGTEVSGTGPEGVPIVIADVTLMGEMLGRGQIDANGHFSIAVNPPLIVNHRIGIMLDPQPQDFQYTQEFFDKLEAFRGDNAITIPRVGEVYDAASVQP
jgi:hypothetical protein